MKSNNVPQYLTDFHNAVVELDRVTKQVLCEHDRIDYWTEEVGTGAGFDEERTELVRMIKCQDCQEEWFERCLE
jgi:hypothetical protein